MKCIYFIIIALLPMSLFISCSSDDNNPEEVEENLEENPTHKYAFTVTGNGLEGVTFKREIPYEDHGGGMAYFEPENNYVMAFAYLNNTNPGIRVYFVYLEDVIQPLAINELTNQDTSVIFVNFNHQGQNYTLESVSGQCTSHFIETFPFGILSSGKSTFKTGFSGTFRNILNQNQTFQITEGTIELYNN